MRYFWAVLLHVVIAWLVWGRPTAGPPEVVVARFLRAVQGGDWGTAQAYMTQHMRGRIGREGFGAMQRYVEARLEPFRAFEIVWVTSRFDDADVVARLLPPITGTAIAAGQPQEIARHEYPGRIEGNRFVHAHRFQLQWDGWAWRIYQFEEVDERPKRGEV